ncbi:MAG: energy transducer TonB [Pseudomonadota bacterium]
MAGVGQTETLIQWARAPLARMLLLSLSLHAAVIGLVQPRAPRPDALVVIHARLSDQVAESPQEKGPIPSALRPAPEAHLLPVDPARSAPQVTPPAPAPAVPIEPPRERDPTATTDTSSVAETPTLRAPPTADAVLPSLPVIVDPHWYEARQLDQQPQAAAAITPIYPADAYRKGIQGSVVLRMKIDEFGQVRDIEVESSDPPGVFDASALEAFGKGRFRAGRRAGQPVRAQILIRVTYEIGDAKPVTGVE